MTDFNQKTHDTDVGRHGGQSRQMMEVLENQEFGSIRVLQEAGKTFFIKEAQHHAVQRDAGLHVQFHSSAKRKSRIFRCLIPFRLISNSSRETTYFGKLSRMLSYAPNSRLTVSSDASR